VKYSKTAKMFHPREKYYKR